METFVRWSFRWWASRVSILPMRHGNEYLWAHNLHTAQFRSYLWGMETLIYLKFSSYHSCFDPTYEAWKLIYLDHSPDLHIRFRSYLWGMETRLNSIWDHSKNCFDPTYEAWKQVGCIKHYVGVRSFDPTYEAWKRFYTTLTFLILPQLRSYLWGMETTLYFSLVKALSKFRSYLWGMETIPYREISLHPHRFRSYLWGMETKLTYHLFEFHPLFRSYLWGMETCSPLQFYRFLHLCFDPTYEAWKLRCL